MRDDDDRAFAAQPRDGGEHPLLRGAVERARRLVEQEDRQACRERATDRDPLALAAGDGAIRRRARRRRRTPRAPPRRGRRGRATHARRRCRAPARDRARARAPPARRGRRSRRACRRERAHPEGPRRRASPSARRRPREILVAPRNRAFACHLEAEKRAEQRRLADPGRAHDRRDLTGGENGAREARARHVFRRGLSR